MASVDSFPFVVKEHVIPTQHIHEYPHATTSERDDILYLVIKQYTPIDNLSPSAGDVTIIATHGSGLPKVRALNSFTT
jgi:hypothetical protein